MASISWLSFYVVKWVTNALKLEKPNWKDIEAWIHALKVNVGRIFAWKFLF